MKIQGFDKTNWQARAKVKLAEGAVFWWREYSYGRDYITCKELIPDPSNTIEAEVALAAGNVIRELTLSLPHNPDIIAKDCYLIMEQTTDSISLSYIIPSELERMLSGEKPKQI